ncbi:MAG: methyltransferase type 11 [Mucilaginibacter sp.]|nr:methyltransferase type 11 [Mucilaginibacter sp.]
MKWNAELYDQKHAFVYQYGESLLELLDAKPGENILDLGCGTGHLTQRIQSLGAIVTGIDSSAEMIQQAEENFPEIKFSVANATNFYFEEPFDAIFSNAVLHWIKDQDSLIKTVYNNLKPGGRFVAEMGGRGNVGKMIAATQQVLLKYGYVDQAAIVMWYFPSLGEYTKRLEDQGFRVTFATHYDRKTPLQDGDKGVAKWIAMFGDEYMKGVPEAEKQQLLKEITDLLEPQYNENGQWYADYKRLKFIAIKE